MTQDPRLGSPDDLDAISRAIPKAPRNFSALRQIIGLLPFPLGPSYPRSEGQAPHDPQEAGALGTQGQLGPAGAPGGFGQTSGAQIIPGSIPGFSLQNNSVTGTHIQANAVTTTHIQTNSITSTHIQANSITSTHIQAGAVTASKIQANSITANEIAANAITADELSANSVSTSKLQASSVTANEIAALTITGAKLADGSVSDVKITGLSADKITAGTISAVTITASNITAGGGGFDGFTVVNGSGASIGSWRNATGFTCNVPATVSNTLTVSGIIDATSTGIRTRTLGAAFSNVPPNADGQLGVDSANGRIYFYHSGGWHYAAQTAGFEVPSWETHCPACGKVLAVGAAVVGRIAESKTDGALHGLYVHFACAERRLDPELVRQMLDRSRTGQPADGPPQVEMPVLGELPPELARAEAEAQAAAAELHRRRFAEAQMRVRAEADAELEADHEATARADSHKRAQSLLERLRIVKSRAD